MIDPAQNIGDAPDFGPLGDVRAVDHDHGDAHLARGRDLGVSTFAARVFGHNNLDPARLHHGQVAFHREGPTRHDDLVAWERGPLFWGIDQTQHIMVLGLVGEGTDMYAPNRQQHVLPHARQTGRRLSDRRHARPGIPHLRRPSGARQGDQRNARHLASGNCIAAHSGGEGMRCIDDMGNRLLGQKRGKAVRATKATHPLRQRLAFWAIHATGKAHLPGKAGFGNSLGKRGGLGRTAKDQNVGCYG